MVQLTPQQHQQLDALKRQWIGVTIRVVDPLHEFWQKQGVITNIEHTSIGWAMKVNFADGRDAYVRRKYQISIVRDEY